MAEIDVLKAQIVRQALNQPWGFRLQGGVDVGQPLSIVRIAPGSPAARIGLRPGDELTEIYSTSTASMTHQDALDLLDRQGDSVILTVERKARGSIPSNPIIQQEYDHLKDYQPMDMSGPSRITKRRPIQIDPSLFTHSTPFENQMTSSGGNEYNSSHSNDYNVYQSSHPHANFSNQHTYGNAPYSPGGGGSVGSGPRSGNLASGGRSVSLDADDGMSPSSSLYPQSRTFRMLQNIMHNESPSAGDLALPPPRSAALEQMRREQGNRRHPSGGRVKVFMPPQYNSPLGMYSADNVLETFTAQAENMLDTIERHN
jgi:hypothetical protein